MSTDQTTNVERAATESVEFETIDRSSFLLKGALATGALYGAAAIGPMVRAAFAQGGGNGGGGGGGNSGDVEILNFALTLELLEADFYRQAVDMVDLGGDLSSLAEEIGANEEEHVAALTSTIEDLGGTPAEEPKLTFPLNDQKSFLKLAVTFEDTGVQAYNGAGPALQSKDLLAVAGQIVQIESRHAAAVRLEDGQQPVLDAFDTTLDMDAVLEAVMPFIQS